MRYNIFIFLLICIGNPVYSQCDVKKNYRPDGVVVKYLNPELVGEGTNCKLGLSIQTNGSEFFFSTTVRYLNNSQKSIGNIKIQLSNSQSIALELFTSELATMKGSKVGLSIYMITEQDLIKLANSTIKTVVFKESNGINQIIELSQNFDVAQRHIKCLLASN